MECWRNVNFRATLFKFLELSSRRARSHLLTHVQAWPCRPAWVVLWLRSSFQINDHKTAPANISEEMPQCDSRLIYRESYITLSHISCPSLCMSLFCSFLGKRPMERQSFGLTCLLKDFLGQKCVSLCDNWKAWARDSRKECVIFNQNSRQFQVNLRLPFRPARF